MPGPKVILSASADTSVREQVSRALKGIEECSLIWLKSGADLLLHILDREIALAIIDESVAELGGAKLVKIIKKTRPKIPLIVISSLRNDDELIEMLEEGIFYFLVTPISENELREAVISALKLRTKGLTTR